VAMLNGMLKSILLQLVILGSIWLLVILESAWALEPSLPQGDTPSREEIQQFFVSNEGNSIRTPQWQNRFQKKSVQWLGQVYEVKSLPHSHRVEVLVKVLHDSILYDTVVVVEGNTQINSFIQKGSFVRFNGTIINGVDAFGVKEVQVLLASPGALQVEGDQPVSWRH
jgi:hypothetical protein